MDAIIICTRDRPYELSELLSSISKNHSSTISKVIIVDSSSKNYIKPQILEEYTFRIEYLKVHPSLALTEKRNLGIERLGHSDEIIHFFDDDITISSNYLSVVKLQFRNSQVVGVGGKDINRPARRINKLLIWSHLDSREEGKLLPSGMVSMCFSGDEIKVVDWLSGCAMSFKRLVFEKEMFDTRRSFDGEDVDFSIRASKYGLLIWEPKAVFIHKSSIISSPTNNHKVRFHIQHLSLLAKEDDRVNTLSMFIALITRGFIDIGLGISRNNLNLLKFGLKYLLGSLFLPILVVWNSK
jgi:GT2 family glycosyltransferase